jgi:hypothetical protein
MQGANPIGQPLLSENPFFRTLLHGVLAGGRAGLQAGRFHIGGLQVRRPWRLGLERGGRIWPVDRLGYLLHRFAGIGGGWRVLRLNLIGWAFLLDRLGYFPHRFIGGGAHLAYDLHRHAHHIGHPLGAEYDERHGENYNDLE